MYANDLVIFANRCKKKSLKGLMEVMAVHEKLVWTLIRISWNFFARTCSLVQKDDIIRETGFKEGHLPMIYLGVAMVKGRLNARHLETLIQKEIV